MGCVPRNIAERQPNPPDAAINITWHCGIVKGDMCCAILNKIIITIIYAASVHCFFKCSYFALEKRGRNKVKLI